MYARQALESLVLPEHAVLQQVVEVTKPPGDEPKTRDAEERIEDLGVDFHPYSPRGVDVVAVVDLLAVWSVKVAHRWRSITEELFARGHE